MRHHHQCMPQHEKPRRQCCRTHPCSRPEGFESLTWGWYEHVAASSHATALLFALLEGMSTEPVLSAPAAKVCRV